MRYNLVYFDSFQCEFVAGFDENNEVELTDNRAEAEVYIGSVDEAVEHCKREGGEFCYMAIQEVRK